MSNESNLDLFFIDTILLSLFNFLSILSNLLKSKRKKDAIKKNSSNRFNIKFISI